MTRAEAVKALEATIIYADSKVAEMELKASRNPRDGRLGAARLGRDIMNRAREAIQVLILEESK